MIKQCVLLRPASPAEAEFLSELAMRSKAYWGYSAEFIESCREELRVTSDKISSPRYYYTVAEIQGIVIGFCALERLSADEFELEALFVIPDNIGTGVGRKLMTHAKSQSLALGGRSISIGADPNAEKFYRAAGGVLTGKHESQSIPGRFLPTLRIDLTRKLPAEP